MKRHWVAGVLCAGAVLASGPITKKMIHNVMTHHPIYGSWSTTTEFLEDLPRMAFTRGWYDAVPESADCLPEGTDLNAIYLGIQENPFPPSPHKPIAATIPPSTTLHDPLCLFDVDLEQAIADAPLYAIEDLARMEPGDVLTLREDQQLQYNVHNYGGLIDITSRDIEGLGNFTLSIGHDERGRYLSFYDIFDFEIGKGGFFSQNLTAIEQLGGSLLQNLGEPIHFYKRWYFADAGITETELQQIYEQKRAEGY